MKRPVITALVIKKSKQMKKDIFPPEKIYLHVSREQPQPIRQYTMKRINKKGRWISEKANE